MTNINTALLLLEELREEIIKIDLSYSRTNQILKEILQIENELNDSFMEAMNIEY